MIASAVVESRRSAVASRAAAFLITVTSTTIVYICFLFDLLIVTFVYRLHEAGDLINCCVSTTMLYYVLAGSINTHGLK